MVDSELHVVCHARYMIDWASVLNPDIIRLGGLILISSTEPPTHHSILGTWLTLSPKYQQTTHTNTNINLPRNTIQASSKFDFYFYFVVS